MFAVTERLLLRPGWPEDAPALARGIGDAAVARMLANVPWPYRVEDAEQWLALPQVEARPSFLLFRRDTAELVGGLGFAGIGEPQLGYWIARRWWGRGYATEAGRAAVALADESLRLSSVLAFHAIENVASARVLAKLGFSGTAEATELVSTARGGAMAARRLARPRFAMAAMGLAA